MSREKHNIAWEGVESGYLALHEFSFLLLLLWCKRPPIDVPAIMRHHHHTAPWVTRTDVQTTMYQTLQQQQYYGLARQSEAAVQTSAPPNFSPLCCSYPPRLTLCLSRSIVVILLPCFLTFISWPAPVWSLPPPNFAAVFTVYFIACIRGYWLGWYFLWCSVLGNVVLLLSWSPSGSC